MPLLRTVRPGLPGRLELFVDNYLIAETTGGRYFRATDAEALRGIFQQIDQLEKTPVEITRFTQHNESYRIPLLIGLAALALELMMSATVVVRVP